VIRQWRALEPWISTEDAVHRHSHHPLTALRDVVTPRREPVIANGTFGDWSPITVHLDGGISVRDRSAPYKGAMFAVYPGDIVFSKIDARSGAIGTLPATIAKAVVTPEFPVFIADPAKLDSGFVQRVLRTGGFLKALRTKATGTSGRKRISPEAFLDLRIPLPDLAEQQAIVAAYEKGLADAITKEQAADAAEAKAMADFEAALGFAPATPLPDRPIFVTSFKDLDRWSHEGVLRRITGAAASTATWPTVRLGEVIADLENGWSPKCLDRPAEAGEWGVLKVSAASAGRYRTSENKALPSNLRPRPRLEVKTGDVLITRASGVANLVGVPAYVDGTQEKLLLCDKLFRAVFRPKSPIAPRFMAVVLRLHSVRAQIVREFSTESGMMKNVSKPVLLSLTFPLPPLDDQRTLIAALDAGRAEAKCLRSEAAVARANAWTAFEASVYAGDSAPAEPLPISEEAAA
jgi:type I restriction enzyme S subunit